MSSYFITRYLSDEGVDIFGQWVKSLKDFVARTAVDRRVVRLSDGNFGDHKFCGEGVWELRVDVGAGYRVYYSLSGKQIVLLLCGGDKRTQANDISRAKELWKNWQERPDDEIP